MDDPTHWDHLPHPGPLAPGPGESPAERAAVVVGLDGSETSWDAFTWACGESRRMGGQTIAVFVSHLAVTGSAAMISAATGIAVCDHEEGEPPAAHEARQLEAEIRRRTADSGTAVAFVHAYGDPARELLRVAGEVRADLIVVGRSTRARHHLAGSLCRHLMTKRCAPIVVVVP